MNLLITVVLVYVGLCLFLMWQEPRLLYYPSAPLDATPDQAGLPYEDRWLTTTDGVTIHGWFIPAAAASSSPATVLFLHGNGGNISHRLDKLTLFHQLGLATLIIDYRGYGRSAGTPSEAGTYADAEAAYASLTQLDTRNLKPETLFLYGESLGSAIAVELATRHRFAGVILEEPFASVGSMGQKLYPFLPVRWLVRNKYDSLSKIHRINAPLLIFHSPHDEMIPYEQGRQLFEAAREPKTFVDLAGGHNDAFHVSRQIYREALVRFLASCGFDGASTSRP